MTGGVTVKRGKNPNLKVVGDRVVTEDEHRTLDLARELLKIPDAEAERILHEVIAEAESFFGGTVEGA